jgi:hypothetical protein
MNQVVQIQFEDKMMSFDTFLSAIRNVVQEELGKAVGKRPFVSQAKAFNTYGRRNVERWVKMGYVNEHWKYNEEGKPTRCHLRISELDACANKVQDFVKHPSGHIN